MNEAERNPPTRLPSYLLFALGLTAAITTIVAISAWRTGSPRIAALVAATAALVSGLLGFLFGREGADGRRHGTER
jgi:hypothetical protein